MRKRWSLVALSAIALTAMLAACSSSSTTSTGGSTGSTGPGGTNAPSNGNGPGKDATKVGFIFVGPKDDYGYNQAAYDGSQAVKAKFPDLEILTAENVPEDDNATRVMEKMISDGAKIIFATSYGHLDPALKVAAAHPDVVVVQQGNFIKDAIPANSGTYFGTVPGTATGTSKPKLGSLLNWASFRLPSSAALSSARVALIGMRLMPSIVALPPDQPVLTSQHFTPPLAMRSFSRLP